MRNNKMKGFTLVELLVVIAILAILATVSVVGYTSYIEGARISNDENIAAQLNRFLAVIEADSNSPYFGEEITPDNAREIIDYVLSECGLEELEPQSAQHGYHFFYDFKEEKIVVLNDAINESSLMMNILRGFGISAINYELDNNPATCFTKRDEEFTKYNGIRYIFLDTKGSEIAELVDLFYGVNTAEDLAKLNELAGKELLDGKMIPGIKTLIDKSIFASASGSYMTEAEVEKTVLFGTTMNSNKFVGTTPVDAFKNPASTIYVPKSIEFFATNSLKFETPYSEENQTVVLHFDYTINELANIVDPDFANVVFTLADGKRYVCDNGAIKCLDDDTSVAVEAKNPMLSFDIEAVATENGKAHNKGTNTANVAWDGTVQLTLVNTKGENDDKYDFISSTNVNWVITSVVVGETTITTDIDDYVTIDANGNLSFLTECDKINVTATATVAHSNGAATQNFVIDVARITAGSVTLFDYILVEGSVPNLTLVKTPDASAYTIAQNDNYTYTNADGITFNENITWTYEGTGTTVTTGTDTITLAGGQGTGVLTIKVGPYLTFTVNLTIEDTADFALQPKNMNNFTVLGNKNEVLLSDLFTLNGIVPSGSELVVFAGGSYAGDTYMTPNRTELQKTEDDTVGLSVDEPIRTLNITKAEDLSNYAFNFTGTDASAIRIAVMHNGVRISEDIKVKIVDAYNVRDYSQIHTWTAGGDPVTSEWKQGSEVEVERSTTENTATLKSTSASVSGKTLTVTVTYVKYTNKRSTGTIFKNYYAIQHTQTVKYTYTTEGVANAGSSITDNIVLVNDIEMPANGYNSGFRDENGLIQGANNALTISGKTIYGNCFTFDITNGAQKNVNGIIVLKNANMQDTRVVGSMYPEIAITGMDQWGSNAVHALGTTTITNCYIANCRAPLATGYEDAKTITAHNITVSNTVLYGGVFANIEHRGGTLTFGENVITINQPHTTAANTTTATDKKTGLGITVWLEAPMSYTTIQGIKNLTQYNFIPSDYEGLPTVSVSGTAPIIGKITASISTQNAFGQAFRDSNIYKFGNGKYINAGVVCEDIGQSNSETIHAMISSMNMPYGDRTGLQANDSISYTSISVPVTVIGMSLSNAPVHFYTMKDTEANQQVFADSLNAECIYSPWEQSFTVEDENSITTTTCKAYGFDSEGKIVPTAEWLAQLMTSTTTGK